MFAIFIKKERNMAFRTKVDISNNRQARQTEQTSTSWSGRTDFGLPFSGLSSGANLTTSAATQVFENVITKFVGDLTGTTFTFGNPVMLGSEAYLNVITPANSNDIQVVLPTFVGVSGSTNPYFLNTVYDHYLAVEYELEVTEFAEYAPNQFSGTAISEIVTQYRADSWDYDGDGVWANINGKLKTEKIIITSGAATGKVLGCLDASGTTGWVTSSGGTSGDLFIAGTGIESVRLNHINTGADGQYSFILGYDAFGYGEYSFINGNAVNVYGGYSIGYGANISTNGDYNYVLGDNMISNGKWNYLFGYSNLSNGDYNLIFGSGHTLTSGATNSAIIGGTNITGTTSNTLYVPNLNIGIIGSGPSTTDIGVDANGHVVDVLSDERLKEDIKPIEGALDKVLNLRGVTYRWKDKNSGGNKVRIGFIAQEVNEVVEELVFSSRDGKYLGVHYDNVTPLLVEAIKELVQNGEDNLITSKYIPKSTNDEEGEVGDVVCDDNFMYVKTKSGWKKTTLISF